jgi:hypothetical protein
MTDKIIKPIEGEVVGPSEAKPPKGVFIGTLNIMAAPAREYMTKPLHGLYRARYHGKFSRPKHVFALDLGLIALGAAMGAIALYFGVLWKPAEPVSVKLSAAPTKPLSGGQGVFKLEVTNDGELPMNNAVAAFRFPKGFSFLRSSPPVHRDTESVRLGNIESGTSAAVRIVGTLNGNVGETLKALVTVSYTEGPNGAAKARNAEASFSLSSSAVGAEFDMPESLFSGQSVTGSVRYWNRGNSPADNIVITPEWPKGFVFSSSSLPLKSGRWEIGTLAAGSESKIDFTGTVSGPGDEIEFGIEAGTRLGNGIVTESSGMKSVTISDPGITIKLDGKSSARLGETITITASFRNSGSEELTEATLKPVPQDSIAFSAEPETISIKPGESGTARFEVKLPPALPAALANATDPTFKLSVSLDGVLGNKGKISLQSPALEIRIPSSLALMSVARYWSETGDQLGRGPMPPETGKATRYWIFWNVKNTTGAVTGAQVSATLPSNVSFTGKVSAPFGNAPEFDPADRSVTWTVGNVPAWVGKTSASVGTAFEIALIPTPDQVGTYPTLVTRQEITGNDSASGLALEGSAADLTSHLTADPKAADAGTVR